jgi:hypothetical protein
MPNVFLLYNKNQLNYELMKSYDVDSIFDTKFLYSFDRLKLIEEDLELKTMRWLELADRI